MGHQPDPGLAQILISDKLLVGRANPDNPFSFSPPKILKKKKSSPLDLVFPEKVQRNNPTYSSDFLISFSFVSLMFVHLLIG
ncbi:hypothetical protein CFP56_039762 [Quercus suber]|uniref:Uncharacterized protein n=1 Tax=Quercus suber TaxID=58331 RepID=A0AAW0M9I4_QUESU